VESIEWTTVHVESADSFEFDGITFEFNDFQRLRTEWGNAPHVDTLESLGVDGWMPRGAGNADPYFYVIDLDDFYTDDEVRLALINAEHLPE
jgi:hypothetical protein